MSRKAKAKRQSYPPICAHTSEEWFEKAKEANCYVECGIRNSRMHRKHCEWMQIMGGVARHPLGPAEPTDFDVVLRSTGACKRCPIYLETLDTALE
jgi:hypothetical protein